MNSTLVTRPRSWLDEPGMHRRLSHLAVVFTRPEPWRTRDQRPMPRALVVPFRPRS